MNVSSPRFYCAMCPRLSSHFRTLGDMPAGGIFPELHETWRHLREGMTHSWDSFLPTVNVLLPRSQPGCQCLLVSRRGPPTPDSHEAARQEGDQEREHLRGIVLQLRGPLLRSPAVTTAVGRPGPSVACSSHAAAGPARAVAPADSSEAQRTLVGNRSLGSSEVDPEH